MLLVFSFTEWLILKSVVCISRGDAEPSAMHLLGQRHAVPGNHPKETWHLKNKIEWVMI